MTTKAADDFEAIRRRIEELKAERDLALTGTTVPQEEPKPVESVYGYGGVDYSAMVLMPGVSMKSTAHPEWPYAGTAHEWRGFVNWDQKLKEKFPEGVKPVETPFMKMMRGNG